MELRNVIELRRSIRSFTKQEISDDIINDLLDCGRLAPSAKNRQPWFFVVLKDEMKNKIADIMLDWSKSINDVDYKKKIGYFSSVVSTAKVMKEANVLLLVFKEKDNGWNNYDNLSIGACIQNILLRATDLNIGSLWIGDTIHVAKEIADMVECSDMELNSAVALGYTVSNPNPRPRKEVKDITKWY